MQGGQHALDVDVHHGVPILQPRFAHVLEDAESCIGNGDIEATEPIDTFGHGALVVIHVEHIEGPDGHAVSEVLRQGGHEGVESILATGAGKNAVPIPHEEVGGIMWPSIATLRGERRTTRPRRRDRTTAPAPPSPAYSRAQRPVRWLGGGRPTRQLPSATLLPWHPAEGRVGSRGLEGGHGDAGLAMNLANVLGDSGTLISVEIRNEHATVGKQNMDRLEEILPEFPNWHLVVDDLSNITKHVKEICTEIDAAVIDVAEPWTVLKSIVPCLRFGGRIACYCPTTSQLEKSWNACEEEKLSIEWAGEIIERKWSKASKGGVRPGNQPMGHTAFLLIATKLASEEEE